MSPFAILAVLLGVCASSFAQATTRGPTPLQVGAPLPPFQVQDLDGKVHDARELLGRPTVVIVTPSRTAGHQSGEWAHALGDRPHQTRIVALVAIDTPFFVPSGMVASLARSHIPRNDWNDTWLSAKGDLRKRLGVEKGSPTPVVFDVDARGRITTVVHGPATTENVRRILIGLQPPPPPPAYPTYYSPRR